MRHEHAVAQERQEAGQDLRGGRLVEDHRRGDARQPRDAARHRPLRINQLGKLIDDLPTPHLDGGHFEQPIRLGTRARSLGIDDDESGFANQHTSGDGSFASRYKTRATDDPLSAASL